MFSQLYDFRISAAICILLCVFISTVRDVAIGGREQAENSETYFLRWNGIMPEIVEHPSRIDITSIPVNLRPIFFEKIPVNQAGCELLETIPGIGPEMAARIVAARKDFGPFNTPESLLLVPGIGFKRKEYLKDHISFAR